MFLVYIGQTGKELNRSWALRSQKDATYRNTWKQKIRGKDVTVKEPLMRMLFCLYYFGCLHTQTFLRLADVQTTQDTDLIAELDLWALKILCIDNLTTLNDGFWLMFVWFSGNPVLSSAKSDTVSKINFLTHWPRALVDEKIHRPSIFFTGKNNKSPLCVTYIYVSVHFIEIIRYYVEYKWREENRAKFKAK